MSKILKDILKDYNHHAYILFRVEPFRNVEGCEILDFEELTVDFARDISRQGFLSAGDTRTMIINCNSMTIAAQNALLKALEDPKTNIRFILSIPHGTSVLETVKSRCVILNEQETDESGKYAKFLDIPVKDKISMVDNVWDSGEVSEFLNGIEYTAHKRLIGEQDLKIKKLADTIYSTRESLSKVNTKNTLYSLVFA